jgi:VWFA-related protein
MLLMGLVLALSLAAQAKQASDQPGFKVRVDLVSLDVEVLDRARNPVMGLKREDFTVKEDGKPVEISNFSWVSDRPVSLTIVLDTSALPQEHLSAARKLISRLAHLLGRNDEICLYTFDARDAYLELNFTTDRLSLIEAMENIGVPRGGGMGFLKRMLGSDPPTALAIDLALMNSGKAHNEKKALLVISNRFKGLGPATVDHVQMAGCTLLAIEFANKANALLTLWGDQISKRQLLHDSGGRQFSGHDDLADTSRAIAYSLKNHYAIGYLTKIDSAHPIMRNLEVRVREGDYVVNARRSYYPSR